MVNAKDFMLLDKLLLFNCPTWSQVASHMTVGEMIEFIWYKLNCSFLVNYKCNL